MASSPSSSPRSSPRGVHIRTETVEFKIKVIEAAKNIGKKPASRLFNVPLTNVKRWTKMEDSFKTMMRNNMTLLRKDMTMLRKTTMLRKKMTKLANSKNNKAIYRTAQDL